MNFRTKKTELSYQERLKNKKTKVCHLCSEKYIIGHFKSFIVLVNQYPYDKISSTNDMLCLKRHAKYLKARELIELQKIKRKFNKENFYDCMIENFDKVKSISGHWHIHLIKHKT